MTVHEVLLQLQELGDEQTKKTLMNHGAKEPLFGVKISLLKTILKKTKKNHELALELYATGNSDAMYLAGLMADEKKMTKTNLTEWMDQAYWSYLCEYAVPWVASESQFGFELGLQWIDSAQETTASGGWSTLASITTLRSDTELDINAYRNLVSRVEKEILIAPNRVKYTMNGFLIAVASSVPELTQEILDVANRMGKVKVDMNGTACKVPFAPDYILKVINAGKLGEKRNTARC